MEFDTWYISLSPEERAEFDASGQEQTQTQPEVIPFDEIKNYIPPSERENQFNRKEYNPEVIPFGGLIGAGIGASPLGRGMTLLGRGLGAAGRAVVGGVEGAASAGAGEYVRTEAQDLPWYYREPLAIGTELATASVRPLAQEATRLGSAALGAVFGYQKGKAAQSILGQSESELTLLNKIFGDETIYKGLPKETTRLKIDDKLTSYVAEKFGIDASGSKALGKKASDSVRNTIFDTLDQLAAQKIYMKDSPQFIEAFDTLKKLASEGQISKQELGAVRGLLTRQAVDPRLLKDPFNKVFINTLQKAKPEFNTIKLSDDTIAVLKKASDDYLDDIGKQTGGNFPTISNLKAIEREEKIALAIDSIPEFISGGFKGKDTKNALSTITATEEGQNALKIGLGSYFKQLPPDKVLKEWSRIKKDIRGLSGIDVKGIDRQVVEFLKRDPSMPSSKMTVTKDIVGNVTKRAIINSIIPAEVAGRVVSKGKISEFDRAANKLKIDDENQLNVQDIYAL
jgi:hypothetical protein